MNFHKNSAIQKLDPLYEIIDDITFADDRLQWTTTAWQAVEIRF